MKDFTEITVRSSVDGSEEPSLLYIPETAHEKTVPLVVGLHTWSYDRFNKMEAYIIQSVYHYLERIILIWFGKRYVLI